MLSGGSTVRRLLCTGALAAGLAVATLAAPRAGASVTAPNPDSAFVTFLFGRAQYETVSSCRPPVAYPDAKSLSDVKALFAPRGWIASPNVVVNYAANNACATGREEYASWAQLDSLVQPPDGWQPISAGEHYLRLANLTASEVQAETCGSLPGLAAQGFSRAWGLYAFPSGQVLYNKGGGPSTGNAMTDIVQHCFAFGRVYGNGINSRSSMRAPWLVRTFAPIGGAQGAYVVPSRVIRNIQAGVGPDHWFVVQFYRFRSGAVAGDHNCLGPESTHYTTFHEEYCWEDFQQIINAISASAVVVDPATVACAWGRLPDNGSHPGC